MKRWPTPSSMALQIMSIGHVSFTARYWPKAVIPNVGLRLCARLLRLPTAALLGTVVRFIWAMSPPPTRPEAGLALLDEAIQTAEKTDQRFFEAELCRLRGEMLLMLGRRDEAEAGLRWALTIAQRQQARWGELRAATTLAKQWRHEGKYLEAFSLLQPVYGWFVEGFDTPSLKDAQALLGELRAQAHKLKHAGGENYGTLGLRRCSRAPTG